MRSVKFFPRCGSTKGTVDDDDDEQRVFRESFGQSDQTAVLGFFYFHLFVPFFLFSTVVETRRIVDGGLGNGKQRKGECSST